VTQPPLPQNTCAGKQKHFMVINHQFYALTVVINNALFTIPLFCSFKETDI